MVAFILFADGELQAAPEADVEHLRKPLSFTYQVAVRLGRPRRKSKPYTGGDENRAEDGYYHGPETCALLTYKSSLELKTGDCVLVPVANHVRPRTGVIIARSSNYEGGLKEIIGRAV
jgi:hypothetical protein